ncbi:hypothetical protein [Algoriphagus chordae]|uniref:Lipoprotein n=1 Tax=Algoriphagus chordae TaxID=237019 RepID=A0A2W7R4E6_9BACT|nr:hypothetical protein [Algoriphagus chordae]PZX55703.1 hypothetical protein LV85_00928 [Algoriphagus chordae]
MKNHFYSAVIAAGLLATACSPSKNSDSEDQTTQNPQEPTAATEASSTAPVDAPAKISNQNFSAGQELDLQGISLSITATNNQPTNSLVLTTEGLEVSNDPQTIEIAGGFIRAEAEDMNSDGSPEFILFFNSYDENPEEFAIGFSVNDKKSMSRVSIPPLDAEQKKGYHGGGDMAIVETKLMRRFPIYEQNGDTWVKTDKMRQLQYSLKEGEAMRQFVVDKVTEF